MASVADDTDNFKAVFKQYKRRDKKLDLSDVFDVEQCRDSPSVLPVQPIIPSFTPVLGTKPVREWKVYHFCQSKGFYLIRNPFLPGFQRYWVSRCLAELPQPPNVTNLRVHPDLNPLILWSDFVSHHEKGRELNNMSPLRKLRWTTIGYHYNWDTKEYSEDAHTPFPEDIGILSQYVAEVLGFSNFQAEAGIINYYHMDSTLAGHTDHSELDHEAPLISISFGQDAIFLLGGPTKATEPIAILLRSGDICVMSGASRLAYHAVPRILPPSGSTLPACFETFPHEKDRIGTLADEFPTYGCNAEALCRTETFCDTKGDYNYREEQASNRQINDSAHTKDIVQEKCAVLNANFQTDGTACVCSSDSSKENCTENTSAENANVWTSQNTNKESSHAERLMLNSELCADTGATVDGSQTCRNNAIVKKVNQGIIQTLQKLDWEPFAAYLSSSRLNVNIRQVLKPGQTFQQHTPRETEIVQCKRPRTENSL